MELKIQTEKLPWIEGKIKGFFGKELLNLQNGSVKLVEIAPKSKYPVHVHPDKTEYAYVLKGAPSFVIGAVSFNGVEGEFFTFPAKEDHAILNTTDKPCTLLVGAIISE
jgi:quercetin dioxygenase-like cupin family protein